jgi:hypothetical protein
MQQRQLRLGDILDDYCPRERRLANHTVVAMVGDQVKLTRCTTCETEHPYKDGKTPRLRKKSSVKAAYDEVLESVKKETDTPAVLVTHPAAADPADLPTPQGSAPADSTADNPAAETAPPEEEGGRLHRPLIRASLPRVETQPPARPIPEFTIRQANRQGRFQNSRAARFAKTRGGPTNNHQGHQGNSRGPSGPHGARHSGRPQGHGSPMRPGPGRHPGQPHGPKKRSR